MLGHTHTQQIAFDIFMLTIKTYLAFLAHALAAEVGQFDDRYVDIWI